MEKQTNDSLSKAVAYLGAVEVAPGRYAFPARTTTRAAEGTTKREAWHLTDANGVIGIIVHAKALSEIGAVALPVWWSLEQRFATCNCGNGSGPTAYATASEARSAIRTGKGHVITADLETGAEMPC